MALDYRYGDAKTNVNSTRRLMKKKKAKMKENENNLKIDEKEMLSRERLTKDWSRIQESTGAVRC